MNRSVVKYINEGVWNEIFKVSRKDPKKFKSEISQINQDPKYKKEVYNSIESKMNREDNQYFQKQKIGQQKYLQKQYSPPKGKGVTPGDFMTYKKYKDTNI